MMDYCFVSVDPGGLRAMARRGEVKLDATKIVSVGDLLASRRLPRIVWFHFHDLEDDRAVDAAGLRAAIKRGRSALLFYTKATYGFSTQLLGQRVSVYPLELAARFADRPEYINADDTLLALSVLCQGYLAVHSAAAIAAVSKPRSMLGRAAVLLQLPSLFDSGVLSGADLETEKALTESALWWRDTLGIEPGGDVGDFGRVVESALETPVTGMAVGRLLEAISRGDVIKPNLVAGAYLHLHAAGAG